MLKREAATEFFQRDRRDLNHECYGECCNWEEVREHYEHDIPAAVCLILQNSQWELDRMTRCDALFVFAWVS